MQRWKLAACFAAITLLSVSIGQSDDVSPDASDKISKLISNLADADPLVRADAVERLTNLREPAWAAIRLALPAATPQTRSEMNQILLHVPWVKPGDSDAVQQAFTGYAMLDAGARATRIDGIAPLQSAVAPALLRVVLSDPSPAVRWVAADALRLTLDDNQLMSQLLIDIIDNKQIPSQMYLPPNENAPLLASAGWVFHESNPQRAADLLQRAVAIETEHPSAYNGQMDFVYLWLIDRADTQRDRGRMVQLLRQQADRTAWNDERLPEAVANLIAAQAEYGPMPGLADDLRGYRDYLNHPEMVYAIGRLVERQGHPHAAAILNTTALLMSGDSADDHLFAGSFLAQHGWNKAAERELNWCLHLSNGKSPYVYFQLSALADERNDDLAAAQYMEAGLQRSTDLTRTTRYGQSLPWTPDEAWAEVHWHYLRAARQANDLPSVKSHLEKLLAMDQDSQVFHKNPGMASDIVPALQDLGRADQADRIFNDAFRDLRDRVTASPEDGMPKNNLAWLCACSGKKLDEAEKLSAEAVAAAPDDAACLDTQAEVYLRLGNPAKAEEIETHALQIKPDDVYMQKQLEKFHTAAANHR